MVPYGKPTDIQYGYRADLSMIILKLLFCKAEINKKRFEKRFENLIVPCYNNNYLKKEIFKNPAT